MVLTAGGTLGSRVLGLVRDQLIAGFFGRGAVASALLFALQIPNLFRRLLGEGALTAAVVPVMTGEFRDGGKAQAFRFLNQVLTRAALLMLGISAVAMCAAWLVSQQGGLEERYRLSAELTVLCMPYMPLICLAALFTAGLNILGRFGVTALSAVWLNVAMISALTAGGFFFTRDLVQLAVWVCCGSLVGGVLQLGAPAWALWREGWRPRFALEPSNAWAQLKPVFLPAVAGAGIQQINFFVSRFLALNVDDGALTVYYLANRVVELPIGVFAITVSTVIFPAMARHAENGEKRALGESFSHGMRLILAINIPAAVGLVVLAQPVARLLFQYGKFDADGTAAMVPLLWIFAAAMPFYGVISLLGRGFNAMRETRIQAWVALWVFLLNLVLSPVLAWLFKAPGLAAANLLATLFQCVTLWVILRRKDATFSQESLLKPLLQCLAASAVMGVCAWGGWALCSSNPALLARFGVPGEIVLLLLTIAFSAAAYFLILGKGMRFPEVDFRAKTK
jgi:putative peptidoglycan lipid II flippase